MTEVDVALLEPIVLSGEEKEIYLENLEKAFAKLSSVLSAEDVDASIPDYVAEISRTAGLLRYNQGSKDPRDNTGTYTEVNMDKRSGFPTLEEMVLFSSKAASAQSDLKRLGTTREVAAKAADVLLNKESSDESVEELEKANGAVRAINFSNRLQNRDYADLPEGIGSKIMIVDLIGEDNQVENFRLFYAAWEFTKHFFNAYSVHLDDDKEKYMRIGPEKPGHIFKEGEQWKPSEDVRRMLASSFGLAPEHYFNAFNILEGIHPQRICYLGIERFESKHSSEYFTDVLKMNPNAGILTATLITIKGREEEGEGKKRQTKFDQTRDANAKLYVICSDEVKSGVIEYYKHNKNVEFEIIPF